jgi:hypothetical protein
LIDGGPDDRIIILPTFEGLLARPSPAVTGGGARLFPHAPAATGRPARRELGQVENERCAKGTREPQKTADGGLTVAAAVTAAAPARR